MPSSQTRANLASGEFFGEAIGRFGEFRWFEDPGFRPLRFHGFGFRAEGFGPFERSAGLNVRTLVAAIAACKFPGIRASVCHDTYSARQAVEHDDMNVLCLGSRVIGPSLARTLVDAFLAATFSGEERHMRRIAKIDAIESRYSREE